MALSVAPVSNPTFTGLGSAPKQTITSVGVATPGSNGFATLANNAANSGKAVSSAVQQGNSQSDQIAALLAQISKLSAPTPQVYAPALDFNSISQQARSAAESNVNPYYTKQLNDFLAQQAAAQQQQQQAHDLQVQDLKDQLNQTLAANDVTKQRTTADTATNIAGINQAQDQSQTDTGQQFTSDRQAQAKALAAAGLTGSGLGAQQAEASQTARNTAEKRQGEAVDQQKQQQELLKSRTFEDLATSGANATSAESKGENKANIDLGDFITNQGLELQSTQSQLEAKRQSDIIQQQQAQEGVLVQNWISGIANPAQRQAALQAYGGLL